MQWHKARRHQKILLVPSQLKTLRARTEQQSWKLAVGPMLVTSLRRATVTEEVTTPSSLCNLLAWTPAGRTASILLPPATTPSVERSLVEVDCKMPLLIFTSATGIVPKVQFLTELDAQSPVVTLQISGGALEVLHYGLETGWRQVLYGQVMRFNNWGEKKQHFFFFFSTWWPLANWGEKTSRFFMCWMQLLRQIIALCRKCCRAPQVSE